MLKRPIIRPAFTKYIFLASFIILAGTIGVWWKFIYSNPMRVFDRMLATNLSVASVTKTVSESDESQKLNQKTQLTTSPVARVHSENVLKQVVDTNTSVTTESVANQTMDFVRYTDIQTGQKSQNGKIFDFSSVLGTWGKSDSKDPTSGDVQLFNQTLLGIVPTARLSVSERKALLKTIKESNAYEIDYSSVEKTRSGIRPVYGYTVSVNPEGYVTLLKDFARKLGSSKLESVNPEDYAGSRPIAFIFEVDVWSGQLVKVTYRDSARTESYSSYGSRKVTPMPEQSIGVQELQTRLQQIR